MINVSDLSSNVNILMQQSLSQPAMIQLYLAPEQFCQLQLHFHLFLKLRMGHLHPMANRRCQYIAGYYTGFG